MDGKAFDLLTRRMGRRGVLATMGAALAAATPFAAMAQTGNGSVLDPCEREDQCLDRLQCVRGRCRIRTGDHCDIKRPNAQCARGFCATARRSPRSEPVCQRRRAGFEGRR